MENEKKNYWIGGILALTGAFLGIVLHSWLFINWYDVLIEAQITKYGEIITNWKVITFILPVFTDFGILAGVAYVVSAYGFFRKSSWAYAVATVANVIALQFSFWPMIPALDTGTSPVYLLIFLPNAVIYLVLHLFVGKRSIGQVSLGLIAGMTIVTSAINGTACLNMWWMKGEAMHILSNRIHWIVTLSFIVITVGILLFPKKEWLRMLGFGMGFLEIVFGVPLGIIATIDRLAKGQNVSMFLAAPVFCILLMVVFVWPTMWNKIIQIDKHTEDASWMIYLKIEA